MLFNSLDFAIFLPIVFTIYWSINNSKLVYQNGLIVIASYIFYGWWDWRFLSLILFSTIVDYVVGLGLAKEGNHTKRKLLLVLSLVSNLGLLGVFKYYNFFLDNFISAFRLFGTEIQANSLNIILPVGISFYTFQTLSYTIDVYRKKIDPTSNFIAFSAFVSFFPQLVAGPIERAKNLLPQFYKKRSFDYSSAVEGMRQILWGLFKKVVIADNCAIFADQIFANYDFLQGSSLVLGALFFTIQIYCDFSGYSDIAIGTAKLFGFQLMQNFSFPYFSRDIAEFWRRWHISLSTWFRDYLYIPLGGSRRGTMAKIRNTFLIFIVSGFWHGANWTFVFWGALNAIYFLPLLLTKRNRISLDTVASGRLVPSFKDLTKILFTFCLTVIAWIFFRAENLGMAFNYLSIIFSDSLISTPLYHDRFKSILVLICALIFFIIEWFGRENEFAIARIFEQNLFKRWSLYYMLIILIMFSMGKGESFIYFQF